MLLSASFLVSEDAATQGHIHLIGLIGLTNFIHLFRFTCYDSYISARVAGWSL